MLFREQQNFRELPLNVKLVAHPVFISVCFQLLKKSGYVNVNKDNKSV